MIHPREAQARVVAAAAPLPPRAVPIGAARGLPLASDLIAETTLPPYDVSAMDGYAVHRTAVGDGPPRRLRVVGEVTVRDGWRGALAEGQAVRISTGGRLPDGAAAIVPVERTGPGAAPGDVEIEGAVHDGHHVRRRGEELRPGDLLLRAGAALGPAAIGMLGALGIAEVRVSAPPRVAVIVTGEEFAHGPSTDGTGRDANGPLLRAALADLGVRGATLAHVGDAPDALAEALAAALHAADIVITTGGASVGPHDHVVAAWGRVGVAPLFHKVAMKPGKPTHAGLVARDGGRAFVFGVPGNPLAVLTAFDLLVAPVVEILAGRADTAAGEALGLASDRSPASVSIVRARLGRDVRREPRTQFLRVALADGPDGALATPLANQGSGMLRGAASSPWVTAIEAGDGIVPAGTPLRFATRAGAVWEDDRG